LLAWQGRVGPFRWGLVDLSELKLKELYIWRGEQREEEYQER
jgi:hypothetical protein